MRAVVVALRLISACIFVATPSVNAASAAWKPARPVELVAPSAAGGGTDITARALQKIFQDQRLLEVATTVVNRPGGAGNIALAYLKQHASDAHYVAVASALLITNEIDGKSTYSYRDFTPLALLSSEYVAFVVNAEAPLKTGKDLLARLAKDASMVSVAVGTSLGGVNHAAAALAAKAAGADAKKLKTVVFKSSAESVTALLGGHVDLVVSSASVVAPYVEAGQLRMLAIAAPRRGRGVLADVPTWKEQGSDIVVDNFRVLTGPPALDGAQIAYWDAVLSKLLRGAEWKQQLEKNLWTGDYLTSNETLIYMGQQHEALRRILVELAMAK